MTDSGQIIENTIRFAPPINIGMDELKGACSIIERELTQ